MAAHAVAQGFGKLTEESGAAQSLAQEDSSWNLWPIASGTVPTEPVESHAAAESFGELKEERCAAQRALVVHTT